MSISVLGISTSPRLESNSDLLLQRALDGAASTGAQVEYVRLSELNIGPCIECNACYATGQCAVRDDYQALLAKMLKADRLIFATPVFFMSVCAQAKMLIDRGQCLWAHKYVLGLPPISGGRDRRAMVIALGGSRSKRMFDGIRLVMKFYFDSLDVCYAFNLFVNRVDDSGQIQGHTAALAEAFRLGAELASTDTPRPEKPVDVELT